MTGKPSSELLKSIMNGTSFLSDGCLQGDSMQILFFDNSAIVTLYGGQTPLWEWRVEVNRRLEAGDTLNITGVEIRMPVEVEMTGGPFYKGRKLDW